MCDIFITENFMQNWILKFNFLWCLNYLLSGSSPNIVITPGPIWIPLRICLAAAKTYGVFFYVIPRICSLNLFCASLNSFSHAGKKHKTFLTTAVAFLLLLLLFLLGFDARRGSLVSLTRGEFPEFWENWMETWGLRVSCSPHSLCALEISTCKWGVMSVMRLRERGRCCFSSQSLGFVLPPLHVISLGCLQCPCKEKRANQGLEKSRNGELWGA